MKITIKNESKSSEIKYPCLMESKSGLIVLFVSHMSGLVVGGANQYYPKGWFHEGFRHGPLHPLHRHN